MGRKKSKRLGPDNIKKTKQVEKIKITLNSSRSVTITREGPDGQPITEEKVLDGPEQLTMVFVEKCVRAGFDFREAFSEVDAAVTMIFQLGYIPSDDEFYELTPEQYEKYQSDMEQTDKRIFMLLPKNPIYQTSSREVGVLTEEQISWFDKAQKVMKQYCRDASGLTAIQLWILTPFVLSPIYPIPSVFSWVS
jgi:hypothetical protein